MVHDSNEAADLSLDGVATFLRSTHLASFLNLFNNNLQTDGLW